MDSGCCKAHLPRHSWGALPARGCLSKSQKGHWHDFFLIRGVFVELFYIVRAKEQTKTHFWLWQDAKCFCLSNRTVTVALAARPRFASFHLQSAGLQIASRLVWDVAFNLPWPGSKTSTGRCHFGSRWLSDPFPAYLWQWSSIFRHVGWLFVLTAVTDERRAVLLGRAWASAASVALVLWLSRWALETSPLIANCKLGFASAVLGLMTGSWLGDRSAEDWRIYSAYSTLLTLGILSALGKTGLYACVNVTTYWGEHCNIHEFASVTFALVLSWHGKTPHDCLIAILWSDLNSFLTMASPIQRFGGNASLLLTLISP